MVQFLCLVCNKNNLQGGDFQHPPLNLLAKNVLLGVSKFTTNKKRNLLKTQGTKLYLDDIHIIISGSPS